MHVSAPRRNALTKDQIVSFDLKVRNGGAPLPAREGACAPQTNAIYPRAVVNSNNPSKFLAVDAHDALLQFFAPILADHVAAKRGEFYRDLFFGASIARILLFGTNLFVFIFNITGAHLRHSHLWLSYGARFSRIFVSPAMHQIHHSRATRHIDRNLGGCLSIWDRLMGTLYVPGAREEMSFGLAEEPDQEYSSLLRLYFLPLLKASKILFKRDSFSD